MISLKEIYYNFITPEESGKKIGLFRTVLAIFGGLAVAYLGMMVLLFVSPGSFLDLVVVFVLFYTFVWACSALWIVLAPSKLSAFLRVIIPVLIFSIFLSQMS